jgi:hypothetical protein
MFKAWIPLLWHKKSRKRRTTWSLCFPLDDRHQKHILRNHRGIDDHAAATTRARIGRLLRLLATALSAYCRGKQKQQKQKQQQGR